MAKPLSFCFRVANSGLKNKKFHFELAYTFFFSLSSYERGVDKWKKFLEYYGFKITRTASFYYVFCI